MTLFDDSPLIPTQSIIGALIVHALAFILTFISAIASFFVGAALTMTTSVVDLVMFLQSKGRLKGALLLLEAGMANWFTLSAWVILFLGLLLAHLARKREKTRAIEEADSKEHLLPVVPPLGEGRKSVEDGQENTDLLRQAREEDLERDIKQDSDLAHLDERTRKPEASVNLDNAIFPRPTSASIPRRPARPPGYAPSSYDTYTSSEWGSYSVPSKYNSLEHDDGYSSSRTARILQSRLSTLSFLGYGTLGESRTSTAGSSLYYPNSPSTAVNRESGPMRTKFASIKYRAGSSSHMRARSLPSLGAAANSAEMPTYTPYFVVTIGGKVRHSQVPSSPGSLVESPVSAFIPHTNTSSLHKNFSAFA
ncbi:hypothetical protein NLJ89_g220 [Agrocybe chaxingu]|uniref:Uncharacterized protein n=1 Tax=Agrocybe chaxingu TaxID=84603 RepID=A0A9W8N2K9_9AGAR|nr:hypothetical protein NLJ89_g220 [Agrocybe chaxingu]